MFTDGYIFICNDLTVEECFSNALFGAPRCGWKQVSQISATTAIFLLRRSKNERPIMYGVFLPHNRPELNIDPSIWHGKYPSQVRVKYYYKFSSSPLITFKNIWNKNMKCSGIGRQLTLRQTLYLITKFIINTRFHLSHQLRMVMGDFGIEGPSERVDQKLLVQFSMCWLKNLACEDQLECLFCPQFMIQHGTLNDFINAIVITGRGEKAGDIIQYLRRDWQSFLNLVAKVGKIVGIDMAEINSILSRRCTTFLPRLSPYCFQTGNNRGI